MEKFKKLKIKKMRVKEENEEVLSKVIKFGLFISYDHPKVIVTDNAYHFTVNKRDDAINIFENVDKESILFKPVIFKDDSNQDDYTSDHYLLDNNVIFKLPFLWPEKIFEGKTEGDTIEMDVFFENNEHNPITIEISLAQQLAFEHKMFEEVLTHKELKRL